jgi:hypothetical protein
LSVGEILIVLIIAGAGAVVIAMFFGAEEVSEFEWKKQKAVTDLEEMRHDEAEKARQRIVDVLNDEGMK